MTRHAFWIVPALALALAAPAAAKNNNNKKEKHQNKVRRETIYNDGRYGDVYGDRYGTRGGDNMRFRGIDRNGDGVITRKEWPGNDKSFNQQDLNRDGILAGREVRTGTRRDTRRATRVQRRTDNLDRLDRNGDGVLQTYEWPYDSSSFNRLDRNRNRIIESWEYRQQ